MKLARFFLSTLSVNAAGLGFGFLVHFSLAAFLPAASYGLYSFIFSIATVLSLVAVFGFQYATQRFIPRYQLEEGAGEKTMRFVRFAWRFVVLLAIVLGALIFGALAAFYDKAENYPQTLFAAGFLLSVAMTAMRLKVGLFKAFHKAAYGLAYDTLFREVLILAGLWGAWALGMSLTGADAVLWLYVGVMCLLWAVARAHISRAVMRRLHVSGPVRHPSREEVKAWLRVAAPIMLIISSQVVLHRSDIIMLGLMVPLEGVGAYGLGMKIAQGASVVMMAALAVFSARASGFYKAEDYAALNQLFRRTQSFLIGGTALICLVLLAVTGPLLEWVGPAYEAAWLPFVILLGGHMLNAVWGPAASLMIMTRHEVSMMWVTFAAVILNLALNAMLIPLCGLVGAAIGTVLTLNLRNAAGYVIYMRDPRLNGRFRQGAAP